MNTAHTTMHQQLHTKNRYYLALKAKRDRERGRFRYVPGLEEEITWTRNDIVEMQEKIRKGVN